MAEWPSTPGVQDLQNVADDVHHGLRHRSLIGEADAIAHVLGKATAAGVPEEKVREIATEQFERLLDAHAPRPSRWRVLRKRRTRLSGALEGRAEVKQLPPPTA